MSQNDEFLQRAETWSKAAAPIWWIVCGFESSKRKKQPLVMLKAYIDDSGKGEEPVFLVAGLVSTAERWAAFSDAWDAKLKEPPGIGYFKMREAWALRGQFERFSPAERDKRVGDLVTIINDHAGFFSFCTISKADWILVFAKRISKTMDSPFYHAYCMVVLAALVHMNKNAIDDTVEFIFDKENETIYREILDWWLVTKETAESWMKPRMGEDPIMRDDKLILPLQAADLLAWVVSKDRTDGPQHDFAKIWANQLSVPGTFDRWDKSRIEDLLKLLESANPSAYPYEDGKARSARLNEMFGARK